MDRKQLIFLIAGSQLQGLGNTLQHLDADTKGTDDLAGTICKAGGAVLVASGTGTLKSQREAITLLRDVSQEWLDSNPAA